MEEAGCKGVGASKQPLQSKLLHPTDPIPHPNLKEKTYADLPY